jgi:hypothetical protein
VHDPRATDTTPLNPPDVEPEAKARELAGDLPREDQDAFVGTADIADPDRLRHTEILQGELEAGVNPALGDDESLEALTTRELRGGETNDPNVAAEEGDTWVPPTDPPVVPDHADPQGARVAAGFGQTAMDEPYDADHHGDLLPDEDEVTARVREALRADARTSRFADEIGIETEGGTVTLRGILEDVDDSDMLVEVAGIVTGVVEVIDETELASG